jgi:hypothetical protein
VPVVAPVPAHADALPNFSVANAATDRVDRSHDLVPRDARVFEAGQPTLDPENVAPTNAARIDLDPDGARTRVRNVALDELERSLRT